MTMKPYETVEISRRKDEPCAAKAKGRMSSVQFKDHSSPFPVLYIHVILKVLKI